MPDQFLNPLAPLLPEPENRLDECELSVLSARRLQIPLCRA